MIYKKVKLFIGYCVCTNVEFKSSKHQVPKKREKFIIWFNMDIEHHLKKGLLILSNSWEVL